MYIRGMRSTTFCRLVELIETYHTWITVGGGNVYQSTDIEHGEERISIAGRMLVLRAIRQHRQHAAGQQWQIPEHLLDKALATYRKQDASFRLRLKKGSANLTRQDAETIVRLATYGVVNLELSPYSLY